MTTILVTGGAGYIGSHTCKLLGSEGFQVVVLDSLEYGHQKSLHISDKKPVFVQGDIGDRKLLEGLFEKYAFDAVVHFAAYTYVSESVKEPGKYYLNNFSKPLTLLDVILKYGCKKFILSSTCATYGNPDYIPIDEKHPQRPLNPYGWSKYFLEQAIKDYHLAHGLSFVFLRYFNASGASEDGLIGEDHDPETHLIPLVLKNIKGEVPELKVFGKDYPTEDGTCIRDYIHVEDLANAHLKALLYLDRKGKSTAFNLGTGTGYSVLEVIKASESVTGKKAAYSFAPRREGDAVSLIADPSKALEDLGWKASWTDLQEIIRSAWSWENGPKNGSYAD
ncbi:UDP-glucose 4-epimerase [Indibacter alkaliphilus LW1]|uniref:UDP-glucose 4-epimerase n=1 Tax=Indibacter alkaliphilus (strain CCUG 57479 / KCTC 22604 / LW1) TaxID=1189612 RepID=S2D391_INDAL|nr:UDP-glucose 4-epimerase GalE [Indibacter alkaliphilus]EOZ91495.1 UDP-glucose 4-epimerase [Indibacter alkaliphilus LW1]